MTCERCGAACQGRLCETHRRELDRATPAEIEEQLEAAEEEGDDRG